MTFILLLCLNKPPSRITSYNVCYTKLLRVTDVVLLQQYLETPLFTADQVTGRQRLLALDQDLIVQCKPAYHLATAGQIGVITSYSIHYTKLYDGGWRATISSYSVCCSAAVGCSMASV